MSKFKEVKVVDNFYQNSLFFPMPTVAISTLAEDGTTTIGAYSLVFPYYIAGKDSYAMLLECRNSSNTAQNILRTGKCALNFIKDDKKSFKELVRLGFPGKTPQEKMKDCTFDLIKGQAEGERPLILEDAYQVIECTWMEELENGCTSDDCRASEIHRGNCSCSSTCDDGSLRGLYASAPYLVCDQGCRYESGCLPQSSYPCLPVGRYY